MYDVAIIGGGIIGASAAALAARAGASVVLFEQERIGAAASGRNSGVLQDPYDEPLSRLHAETLALYRELAAEGTGFTLPPRPAGLLLVSADGAAVVQAARRLAGTMPRLRPLALGADELQRLEPNLAPGIGACLLETGYPVVPAAATESFAELARRYRAELRVGEGPAELLISDDVATGVRTAAGEVIAAGSVLVAAGPWTPALVPGWRARPPVGRTWGVVVATRLSQPPRRVLEELEIDPAGTSDGISFSLVTAGGVSSVGSTFMAHRPDPAPLTDRLLAGAARFVPGIATASVVGTRLCARPVSYDGRPLVGPVRGIERLFVCAGHGPWGMSTGPASARLVVDPILGRAGAAGAGAGGAGAAGSPAAELAADRYVTTA